MADILIVEDSQSTAAAMAYCLWNVGHSIIMAESGQAALTQMKSRPDLVILDYELPDISGADVMKAMLTENPEALVILVTGKGSERLAAQVLRDGAKDYLIKSEDLFDSLPRVVEHVLNADLTRRELEKKDLALREAYATLEKRVVQRTEELTEANKRLLHEVEERRRSEDALRRSEELHRRFLEASPDPIVIYTMKGRVIYVNPAFIEKFGWSKDELIGQEIDYVPDENRTETEQAIAQFKKGENFVTLATKRRTRDGRIIDTVMNCSPFFESDGTSAGIIVFLRDVTGTKRLEEQLRQAQRLEAIGTLASGIAHDFNNILSVITGYTELARLDLSDDHPLSEKLDAVLQASSRAKDLVYQILTFGRQTEPSVSFVRLEPILKETVKFLRASLPVTIAIHLDAPEIPGGAMADPTQIHQVIMNLCTNAAQAMKATGGRLEILLAEKHFKSRNEISRSSLKPGRYIQLTVSDTGVGMDEATLDRIFEPYFTTKAPGEGTGMGLAVVHGIVTGYGGAIDVAGKPGQGTTFDVYLPLIDEPPGVGHIKKIEPLAGGNQKILLVDDEEILVDINRRMLTHLGYDVAGVTDGHKALEEIRNQPFKYDLVITDLTMPTMNGLELAEALKKTRSDLAVILCTGYSDSLTADRAKILGVEEVILKPLVMLDLATAVKSAFEKRKRMLMKNERLLN